MRDFVQELPEFSVTYEAVDRCPLCNCAGGRVRPMSIRAYRFFSYRVPIPSSGISLRECPGCGLFYKDFVPTRESLSELYSMCASNVWESKGYSLSTEKQCIRSFAGESARSVIDIGSSDGALLRAFVNELPVRSALDVYEDARCRAAVTGEYVIGFIEDPEVVVNRVYDIATAFDVFEHFYSPIMAAQNLARILRREGVVVGETGDADSEEAPQAWWYAELLEHHIFWTRRALNVFCERHGFRLEMTRSGAHKGRRYMPPIKRAIAWVLHTARDTPFAALAWRLRRIDARAIGNPFKQDHFIFVLRKI